MTGKVQSGNYAHDVACALAEGVRQASAAGATSNAAGQVTINTAEIAWARSIIASCKANNNNVGMEPFQTLLRALGTGGT